MSQATLKANLERMRQRYNLIRGLSAESLASLLDAATDRGEFAQLQWMFHRVTKRWPILRALRERRASALLRKEWDIVKVAELPKGATEAQAQAQADALRAAYMRLDNLSRAVRFLSVAEFCGFSHLQKHRDASGNVIHLEPLDQWNWVRDGYRGPWYWNPTADPLNCQALKGRPEANIDPAEFVIREVENPIYEAALPLYLQHTLARRDWAAYTEIFGIPKPQVIRPGDAMNSTELTTAQQSAWDDACVNAGLGGTGHWPAGTQVLYPTEGRAAAPFAELIGELERELCVAVIGGELSMLNGPTGLGSNTSKTHQDAFNEIVESEAMEISEVFQSQFDNEILARQFNGQPVLAFFRLAGKEEVDVTAATTQIQNLSLAGYDVDPAQITELTGYRVSKKAPPVQPGFGLQPDPDADPGDQGDQNGGGNA